MFTAVRLKEYEIRASWPGLPFGFYGGFGEGCGGAKGRDVFLWVWGQKGPVCPGLAHALHSHTLSSPGEEGAWKERGLPLGPEPGLPLCQPHLGGSWCSGSLLQ